MPNPLCERTKCGFAITKSVLEFGSFIEATASAFLFISRSRRDDDGNGFWGGKRKGSNGHLDFFLVIKRMEFFLTDRNLQLVCEEEGKADPLVSGCT